ncbi:conjugal transfer protein, partial [Salmonella enterica subsp. enterica]|nr:conjugal transfer protein [Salmonella enterica subsp. enterica]
MTTNKLIYTIFTTMIIVRTALAP